MRKKCIVMISVYRLRDVKHGYCAEVNGYFAIVFILCWRSIGEARYVG